MENFQPYFPCSSSASSCSLAMVSPQTNFSDFQGNKPSGFFGLMPEMEVPAAGLNVTSKSVVGSESEENLGKKKGSEKKIRKPRYAFQTRSQVDILDDGYRWRKYGQKAVKNNKFPRSYYRCTHQGCNVKKQVQRLTKDEGVVVTTYEGMHSHPIEKSTDNFEHILGQMQIYTSL
ncbi:probable WRKY transcription factor 75 [Mangifera indica]|uniref:probable WRKY transcription factor 75 n=1 Tax=Mangifera indica TaxID=29780 RepID=UPI001CFB1799|nr:probable WRKY transcription factor 75 [Mangifera indica]WEX24898.1 WRKY75 [Mangifera indica]